MQLNNTTENEMDENKVHCRTGALTASMATNMMVSVMLGYARNIV
jgi:hypothetical protein